MGRVESTRTGRGREDSRCLDKDKPAKARPKPARETHMMDSITRCVENVMTVLSLLSIWPPFYFVGRDDDMLFHDVVNEPHTSSLVFTMLAKKR
jgi:hypothetical protein